MNAGLALCGLLSSACNVDRSGLGEAWPGMYERTQAPAVAQDAGPGDDVEIIANRALQTANAGPALVVDAGLAASVDSGQLTGQQGPSDGGSMASPAGLASPAFADGAPIPNQNACGGADLSPALSWPPGPNGTQSYAIVLRNLDATVYDPTAVLWAIWDIPSTVTSLPADLGTSATPSAVPGARQVSGWAAQTNHYYQGPCASGTHRYEFALYALSAAQLLGSVYAAPAQIEASILNIGGVLEKLTLTGIYSGP